MKAVGPLREAVETDGQAVKAGRVFRLSGYEFGSGASALIMMNRVAFFDHTRRKLDEDGQRALFRWAVEHDLGQDGRLLSDISARRDQAVAALRGQDLAVARLLAEPEWRLAVGLGNKANPYEIGLSLHGTYGCPVIPATSLKGLAAAWALANGSDPGEIGRVLGSPRPKAAVISHPSPKPSQEEKRTRELPAAKGSVCFLDAIPLGEPVTVTLDVLTPHVKPYYDAIVGKEGTPLLPPAEYHNPVPVNFLTVRGGFAVDLYGENADDVRLAARWLSEAGTELGAGGKTAAGYGYLVMKSRAGEGSG